MRCSFCDGVFSWPFVGGGEVYFNLILASPKYPQQKWEFTRALTFCAEKNPLPKTSNGAILEIGAGDGAFIRLLISQGVPPGLIYATEYSEYGRKTIESLCPSIKVGGEALINELAVNKAEQFSHIFLFQVLPHLRNFEEYITLCKSLLKEGGSLIFAVPNPTIIEFNELNGLELDMPPNHLCRFPEKAVRKLAIRHRLLVDLIEDEPFDIKEFFRMFLISRYYRQSQLSGTLANYFDQHFPRKYRKLAILFYMFPLLPLAFLKSYHCPKVGISRLIALRKEDHHG